MKLDTALLDTLTAQARTSPRLRQHYDLRNTPDDNSQRILNALEPGTVLPIHRHRESSETVVMLRGKGRWNYYDDNSNLMFNLDEMADYMKERFSKSGAEEASAMLYHLAVEHGTLAEETFRQIDSIVPAILKRNKMQQIFNLHHVSQFTNNLGSVVNSSQFTMKNEE